MAQSQAQTASNLTIEVNRKSGETVSYQNHNDLKQAILSGELTRDLQARTITQVKGVAKPGKWRTLEKEAGRNAVTRYLYQPVWAHALRGLLIGWLAGFLIKGADSAITYYMAGFLPGLLWTVFILAIAVSFIPKLYNVMYVAFVAGLIAIIAKFGNLWFGAIAVAIVAFLGVAPFGMAIGTIVGYVRKKKVITAPDAVPEGPRTYWLGIILPVIVGAGFLVLYFMVLNPLLLGLVSG